jgi:hypothetical protein
MSPRDISAIIKEEEDRRQKYKHDKQQQEISSKAYKLFSEGKRPVDVAIALNLREPEATKLYREYWKLKGLHKLNSIYKETDGKLGPFLKLYRLSKEEGMSIEQVVNAVDIAIHKLPYMEALYGQVKEQVDKMQHTRQHLVNDIQSREYKISILDKTAFSSEQECRRIKHELCELIDKKDRIEKLIANILNNDNEKGYSKLKQIIKENVKAALSENKQLISVSLAALIHTLKSDPEMTKLIYNIPTGNDGEEHKDNNIIKYLESNKDSILYLAEKNYENLVEVLTHNVMDTAGASSNPALSLSASSSTVSNPSTQSDTYRKEEPDTFHNNKGDIAE